MEDRSLALALAASALFLIVMQGKQITRMRREIDLLVKGDTETLLLKRKLDGYQGED